MPLTQDQYSDLIIAQVGDTSDGLLAQRIALLWTMRDAVSDLDSRALYVKLDAIDLVIGHVRSQVTIRAADGSSADLNKLFDHLMAMRQSVGDQIEAAQAGLGGGIAVGTLTTTAPISRDNTDQPDPNDRVYRGDPLKRRGGVLP